MPDGNTLEHFKEIGSTGPRGIYNNERNRKTIWPKYRGPGNNDKIRYRIASVYDSRR